jgi:hypothetical protein
LAKVKLLHERKFAGKPVKSFKVYEDPFGENEICVELAFVDGQIELVCIGPGKPGIVSSGLCYQLPQRSPKSDQSISSCTTTETGGVQNSTPPEI